MPFLAIVAAILVAFGLWSLGDRTGQSFRRFDLFGRHRSFLGASLSRSTVDP
jgi:hypothetical protein